MGFIKPYPPFACPSGDGRNFVLVDNLYYIAEDGTKYRGMVGATTDGASTPQIVWSKFPPFGQYWLAAIFHDFLYRAAVEIWSESEQRWVRTQVQKDVADRLLLEAMNGLGVDHNTQWTIYNAVKDFGDSSFSDDLAKPIT
jgi:hypothetical protein